MAVYNGEKYLNDAITSVVNQSYTSWELIVVNDGSTDGSEQDILAWMLNDSRIIMIRQPNSGVANARNTGLANVSEHCHYTMFFDQDDILAPNALKLLAQALSNDRTAAGAHGYEEMFGGRSDHQSFAPSRYTHTSGERKCVRGTVVDDLLPDEPTSLSAFVLTNPIVTPGLVLLRRTSLDNVGALDSSMAPSDDWDLWMRICRTSHLTYVHKPVLKYRVHENNNSRNHRLMVFARHKVFTKVLKSDLYSREQKKLTRLGFRLCQVRNIMFRIEEARNCIVQSDRHGAFMSVLRIATHVAYYLLGPDGAANWDRLRGINNEFAARGTGKSDHLIQAAAPRS